MSFLCFKCKKRDISSKDHQRDSSNSTTNETAPIVKQPRSRRNQTAHLPSISVGTSLSDLSPPPPCVAHCPTDYLSGVHYSHGELYPDSFLIHQPNTPMQFFLELSGNVDDSSRGHESDEHSDQDYPPYDYPKNNRLVVSLQQGDGDAMVDQHVDDALAPDEDNVSTSGDFSYELHPVNEEPLHTEPLRSPCTQSMLKDVLKWQGTPPLPRTSKRLSLWVPAVTSGCIDAMKDAFGNPRPCSLPQPSCPDIVWYNTYCRHFYLDIRKRNQDVVIPAVTS